MINYLKNNFYHIVVILSIIITSSVFRIRAYGATDIDFQIVLKLCSWTSLGLVGLFVCLKRASFKIGPLDVLYALYFLYIITSSIWSSYPFRSLVMSSMALCIWIGIRAWVESFDAQEIIDVLKIALLLFLVGSVIVYFVIPYLGRQGIWVENTYIYSSRMTGLCGGANALGEVASFFSLICYYNYIKKCKIRDLLALFLGVVVLIMSWNKMGVATFLVGVALIEGLSVYKISCLFVVISCIALVLMFFQIDEVLTILSRTGRAEEILNVTGRTKIWPIVLENISNRPILGSGYAVMSISEYAHSVGFVAAHSHNTILQVFATLGTFGFVIFLACTVYTLSLGISLTHNIFFVIYITLLLRGITESGPVMGTPNFSLYIWMLAPFILQKEFYAKDLPETRLKESN